MQTTVIPPSAEVRQLQIKSDKKDMISSNVNFNNPRNSDYQQNSNFVQSNLY